ncbi:hypothetical protein [Fibrobacter sp. UWEL]|uniref:type IV toxin-antitoxin system AbiEi family antitoxin domain-containing protein n=1 Tax=Fibrobacter sp. UWEL TaxID=1896209 RepID=UPI0009147BDA|nr:hypothetical protein [Fibrobacter sp. UWEL]SHL05005.1 Transcriptional regulator, AbiEi antitoxin, Type IV TA system [Fibrobacter sp. UWEL]
MHFRSWEILEKLSCEYKQPDIKLKQMVKKGELIKVIRGLYEEDRSTPPYLLAGAIYGPSYISFEYALSRYGLIPERVSTITSATYRKGKNKTYETPFGTFSYSDIPALAYPHEVTLEEENGQVFQVALPEKALCDTLYKERPVGSIKALQTLMFEDLRIDKDVFNNLDKDKLFSLAALYTKRNLQLLTRMREP